jgi:dTDP-4-amino-4,6-dideoxygalactose transaminase
MKIRHQRIFSIILLPNQQRQALHMCGVSRKNTNPYPIYRNELFKKRPHVVHPCPEAEAYCRNSVWLPHNVLLADEDWIGAAVSAIDKVCRNAHELGAQSPKKELLPVTGNE